MKRFALYILLSTLFVSCGSRVISDQQKSFKDKKWQSSQFLTYAFTITDTAARYDISATVKHFDNYPFDRMQLSFILDDPSGEKRTTEHDLLLRNKEGRFPGKKIGDTLKMNFAIRNQYRFKATGLAKVTLVNRLPYPVTDGIGGISIIVRKR
jgi:gliding motility-associated lipoprotein GldH